MTVKTIVRSQHYGSIYGLQYFCSGKVEEGYYDSNTVDTEGTCSVFENENTVVMTITVDFADCGDIMSLRFTRDGTHGSDDDFSVWFVGWIIEYTAEY